MSGDHLNIDAMEDRFVKSCVEIATFEAALPTNFPDPELRDLQAAKLADDRAILIERMKDDLLEAGQSEAAALTRVSDLVTISTSAAT